MKEDIAIQKIKQIDTLGLKLSSLNYQEALTQIGDAANYDPQGFACFANAHMTVEAHWDRDFSDQLQQARFIFPDGMPLVWAMQILHQKQQERIAGMDVLPALFQLAEQDDLPVYFYGTTQNTLNVIRERLAKEYPKLKIAGMTSPSFKTQSEEAIFQEIEHINSSGAKLVFVALGCPKQEKWMAKYSLHIRAVLLGVGGAFSVFAQTQKRAPLWMRKIGLEWLFRFLQEPHRLWKRYLITNTVFLWLFLKSWILKK